MAETVSAYKQLGLGGRTVPPALLQMGHFKLNSGATSHWKLECDALTDTDWDAAAYMVWQVVGPFDGVEGVPRGGLKLAERLTQYSRLDPKDGLEIVGSVNSLPYLIVDDVLTTGGSLNRARDKWLSNPDNRDAAGVNPKRPVVGVVLFARGPCPSWVGAVFMMPEKLWINKDKG